MKELLYHSEFVEYHFENQGAAFYETWSEEHLTDSVFKEETLRKRDFLNQYKPKLILDDISRTDFTITPELQEWTAEALNQTFLDIGLKKYAVVMPASLFGQVSMEQTVDEVHNQHEETPFELHLFDNMEEAEKWLFN